MKKSLIALAVAGAFAAPAFAATSNVDVYGVLNVAIQDTNSDNVDMAVVDNVSRIGFKGSEDLGGGLKAVWQIEQGISAAPSEAGNSMGGATLGGRNTFIGLAGGFGTVLAGRHDTPYKIATGKYDIFADTVGDYNGGATGVFGSRLGNDTIINNAHDARAAQALAYVSPSMSGLTVAAAVVMGNNNDAGASTDKTSDAFSLALMYANGPLTVDFGYQTVDNPNSLAFNASTVSSLDAEFEAAFNGTMTTATSTGKSDAWKLGAGYTFGDAKVGFVYENVKVNEIGVALTGSTVDLDPTTAGRQTTLNIAAGDMTRKAWLVNGAYTMGPVVLKAQYGQAKYSDDFDGKSKGYALGADYNLSKRTTAYFAYASMKVEDEDRANGWNLGVKHSF